jgi:hypothetical protein
MSDGEYVKLLACHTQSASVLQSQSFPQSVLHNPVGTEMSASQSPAFDEYFSSDSIYEFIKYVASSTPNHVHAHVISRA